MLPTKRNITMYQYPIYTMEIWYILLRPNVPNVPSVLITCIFSGVLNGMLER